ncbi:MAG TPA: hypothetical protein VFU54_01055, partial [Actinomycetota bacterium]|nr:hypothetical protein [Actinomycetota bacterium]
MEFRPDDEEAFYQAQDELLDQFAAWAERQGPQADPTLVSFALDYKWGYGDGHLGRWTTADLTDLLINWFPRKVSVFAEEAERVVPSLRAFLDWLAEEGLLDPTSDRPPALRATLERLASRFPAAMDDPSLYGPAKSLVALMQSSGIDVTDQDAISGFIGGFNELPEQERKRLLPLPGEEPEPLELPPVRLAPQADLVAAADIAPGVERLRGFTSWVGQGRKLTQKGRLTLADAKALVELLGTADKVDPVIGDEVFRTRSSAELPEVAVTFAWAKATRLVRVVHGRVVPVKRSQPLLDRPLELWERALEGLGQLGPDIFDDHLLWSFLADDLDSLIPGLLSALYLADEPVPLRALADHAWNDVRGGYVLDDEPSERLATWRWKVAADLDRIIQHLELLGAVERIPANAEPAPDLDDELPLATRYLLGGEGMLETGFQLTPLGLWGANRLLRGLGVDAPAVGDLVDADVATLLARCADFDPEACQEELRTWCEARGAEVAAAELVAFLRRTDEPQARMLGFTALGAAGEAGVEAVRALQGDPGLHPYATLWLVDRGLEKQEAVRPEMAAHMLVETCAAVAAQDGPSAVVQMLS